ncbi:TolC family protein [Dyadobacter fermentans]|uniref:Outer membrane efflux protein n=1 Tax=Dyadobacter fermentans (strain ATCC 700827 / DSM 18053 / CIP 107007 / KCTC 52180 / NS114) TaxID=471854 RepID=C6VWQ0_DYAFD|nr:TolC family protein [Dyadobacter fermentans]ACT96800.1 outer membrane efflux protein [Dyadobacter fermentans DSM 18053]
MTMRKLFIWILVIWSGAVLAQTRKLTLEEVVQQAREQSIASKQAVTQKKTNYWQYRSFLADYKPQLSLLGTVPGFTRSYIEVVQPDGTVSFQPVSNNNSMLNLSLSQSIAMTGGTVYVQQQMQRFDDFQRDVTRYNGIPFEIGIQQPLFRFNPLKWDRKIQPLKYQEGNQQYIQALEQVALDATGFYFELLVAQVNLQIAEKNRSNNDTLFKIARHKLELGKISQNDLLQLQMGLLTAQKDLASAQQSAAVASLKLKMYMGSRDERALELGIPSEAGEFAIDPQMALDEAFANRSASVAFRRRLLEAERDVQLARKDNGLNATLNATFGLSNQGNLPRDVYRSPQDREFVELQLTLPILTWGRNKARTEVARAAQEFAQQSVEQDKLTFEQEIFTQVTLLQMLQKQVKLTEVADGIAADRYQIAKERFILSDLSVTDLGIATQEKDIARRDYILALRDYWQAYYSLRLLTLYDFQQGLKISY